MKKKIAFVAVGLVALFAGGFYFSGDGGNEAKNRIKTMVTKRGDLVLSISATGAIEPNFQVEVKSKASGEIMDFPYEPGDTVKKGDRLLTLDPSTEQRNLAQIEADRWRAKADVESAQASLDEARSKYNRAKALMAEELISQQDMESAASLYASAQAKLSVAQAAERRAAIAVEEAKDRVRDTVVTSPMDGILLEKTVERGQIISSGISSFTGGTKLCVVADVSRVFILVTVDETDIGKVAPGQRARITVDAHPENVFEGVVERVYPKGEEQDKITIFKVKVEIIGEGRTLLKSQMTANVDIIQSVRKNVIAVPDEALKTDDEGKTRYVTLLVNGKQEKRFVKTGLSNGFDTEIAEGLSGNETVITRMPAPPKDEDK
ncbi:MAG: efflux RND transporter periplasmic adaptor subunit [Nitrospinae bacterium]|nr:efflux RND transporter periplasmic adaptor subunit [Nitrospinota bacterium]